MELRYRPPLNLKEECDYLEKNMLTCLKEKSAKDQVNYTRQCKPENVRNQPQQMFYKLLWFFLECPNRGETYENKEQLRKVFIEQKQLELNPPKKTGARK